MAELEGKISSPGLHVEEIEAQQEHLVTRIEKRYIDVKDLPG
jgi:hypothetical protein